MSLTKRKHNYTKNHLSFQETLQKTLEEALQTNEPFDVHSKLLDIYVETSKHQELVGLVELMMRKYKRETRMYTQCGAACFKLGLVDKARQVWYHSNNNLSCIISWDNLHLAA